jgi:hypothetical protein
LDSPDSVPFALLETIPAVAQRILHIKASQDVEQLQAVHARRAAKG